MNDRPGAFLDRDGTLIRDTDYPRDPALVELLPGAADALKQLRRHGYALVVVSNQSGIGRGLITPGEAAAVHERFVGLLADHGITLDGAYYCPHTPDDGCGCRKPAPGLLVRAAKELGLDIARSVMIGDKASDVEAGESVGCRAVRFKGDWSATVRASGAGQGPDETKRGHDRPRSPKTAF